MFILHTLSIIVVICHLEYVALLNEFMREYSSVYGGHRNVYTHTHTLMYACHVIYFERE